MAQQNPQNTLEDRSIALSTNPSEDFGDFVPSSQPLDDGVDFGVDYTPVPTPQPLSTNPSEDFEDFVPSSQPLDDGIDFGMDYTPVSMPHPLEDWEDISPAAAGSVSPVVRRDIFTLSSPKRPVTPFVITAHLVRRVSPVKAAQLAARQALYYTNPPVYDAERSRRLVRRVTTAPLKKVSL
ncbi:hypothetical protein B0H17DRAFT_1196592 [Mycena rosella]|uniref:Uncharacterized protein n=1 Tax=Mycena rosella TaxID=1033263 RepID=A0AAD7DV71_MYCRO|nr:hypothetical protein B0H17DRAFT_1196592 [Mycena rosella]